MDGNESCLPYLHTHSKLVCSSVAPRFVIPYDQLPPVHKNIFGLLDLDKPLLLLLLQSRISVDEHKMTPFRTQPMASGRIAPTADNAVTAGCSAYFTFCTVSAPYGNRRPSWR